MADEHFTWLHLSDLHVGMQNQGWLWPTLKTVVFDDLRRVHAKTGPWDLVIFSGDITQRGSKKEFEKASEILSELWDEFRNLGFQPKLFLVPGNHDLVRPADQDPAALLLKQWWEIEQVRTGTWSDPSSIYQKALYEAFENYTEWLKTLPEKGIDVVGDAQGIMPGDVAGTLETEHLRVGLVGLNSTWLQLDGTDWKGRLAVDPRQLTALTNSDPDSWTRQNDLSLLVSHHPTDWLHPASLDLWNSEIDADGRFSAHVYGHMHLPDASSTSHGGSASKQKIQAASLFGLELIEREKIERIHGYSVSKFTKASGITVWPRRSIKLRSGSWKLAPDVELDLDENESFRLGAGAPPSPTIAPARTLSNPPKPPFPVSGMVNDQDIERVRYYIQPSPASINVRKVEQRVALNALSDTRAVWLTAEWGSNSNGFVRAVQERLSDSKDKSYRIDFSEYVNRADFLAGLKAKIGLNFEQLCDALSEIGSAYLILEDVPVFTEGSAGSIVPDIEDLISVALSYCPSLKIFLRTRHVPRGHAFPAVVLRALDEADLALYVGEHEHGGPRFTSAEAISDIYRHTDGVPARVDAALRELDVIPLNALTTLNRDIVRIDGMETVPKALAAAVLELKASEEPQRKRSFDLLTALSAFPRGETLERLKRFYDAAAIYPVHAHELIDKSLISTGAAITGPGPSSLSTERLLTVPKAVRDYVMGLSNADELAALTKRAAELYFGNRWYLGEIRSSLAAHFNRPNASSSEIENASAIVLRLLNDALDRGDDRGQEVAIDLAKAYVVALFNGDHFRSVVTLSRDMLKLVPDTKAAIREFFRYEQAKATRMTGENADALEMLNSLSHEHLTKHMRQSALVAASLAYQSLGQTEEAVAAANDAIKIDKNSHGALQAKSIILDEDEDEEASAVELKKLEAVSRKKGAHVVANNIALSRLYKDSSSTGADLAVTEVLKSAGSTSDYYNAARAIIKKAEIQNRNGVDLAEKDKDLLINAYHFLLGERLPNIFDKCHDALWEVFEKDEESSNLFSLFRHSSLIWRLRGDTARERRYLTKLARHAEAVIGRDFRRLDKEIAYYLVRQGAREDDDMNPTQGHFGPARLGEK